MFLFSPAHRSELDSEQYRSIISAAETGCASTRWATLTGMFEWLFSHRSLVNPYLLLIPQTQKRWRLQSWETLSSGNSTFSSSLHVTLLFIELNLIISIVLLNIMVELKILKYFLWASFDIIIFGLRFRASSTNLRVYTWSKMEIVQFKVCIFLPIEYLIKSPIVLWLQKLVRLSRFNSQCFNCEKKENEKEKKNYVGSKVHRLPPF